MRTSHRLKKLLHNRIILYVVVFIALTNVVGYISLDDFESLTFFCVIGILSSFFSKNMIINLSVAILSTNVLFAGNRIREGLENKEKKKEALKTKGGKTKGGKKEGLQAKGKKRKGEKFTQKNVPPSRPAPATEKEEDNEIGKRIDYASTMEQAYDNLSKMLGPEGINGLSNETKSLVAQQKSLMENLNSMAPVLQTAKETLDSLGGTMPNLANLQGLMKQFGGLVPGKQSS